jgi:hypothetical protein
MNDNQALNFAMEESFKDRNDIEVLIRHRILLRENIDKFDGEDRLNVERQIAKIESELDESLPD